MDYRKGSLPQTDAARGRSKAASVRFRVCPSRPEAHLFAVECDIQHPDAGGETIAMPAWIPGSYLIRDFARHVVSMAAEADGTLIPVCKLDQHTWRARPPAGCRKLSFRYEVYAWDLSVRGAHLDTSHGFFNGTSVFVRVLGREAARQQVHIVPPPGAAYRDWQVATTLPPADRRGGADAWGFGHFEADDYAALIDHPVEMGRFDRVEFRAAGVPHAVAITGRHRTDTRRLARDLETVCSWHQQFWGSPSPFDRYLFLVTAVGDGYGGLEHRDSTALLCRRDDLPNSGDSAIGERYRTFLGLASHEYFHAWLVKRLIPAEFANLDLQRENPTELLWLFEGFTSYYDDLALRRCGLISESDYLSTLARTIGQVAATPGRLRQSVAQASFDAWSKYYRPDENSPNATVSYYTKGSLVALALDLTLRARTDGRSTLDDVMRALWQQACAGEPQITEQRFRACVQAVTGVKADRLLDAALHGTDELPLARLLATHGLALTAERGNTPSLGLKLDANGSDARVAHVYDGGAAMAAGLAGGDILLAIDGLRVTPGNLTTLLARYAPGSVVSLHAFRRDELITMDAVLQAPEPASWSIAPMAKAAPAADRLRTAWLGDTPIKAAPRGKQRTKGNLSGGHTMP